MVNEAESLQQPRDPAACQTDLNYGNYLDVRAGTEALTA